MTYYRPEQIRGIDRCLEKVLAVRREGRGDRQLGHQSAVAEATWDEGQSCQCLPMQPQPIHSPPWVWTPLAKGSEQDCCPPHTLATDRHSCHPGPAAWQDTIR